MSTLTQALTRLLHNEGCTLIGIADLSPLPQAPRKSLPVGIVVGQPLCCEGVEIPDGNAPMLVNVHGGNTFEPLERYLTACVKFLKEHKFKANTKTYLKGEITDKTVATLGGLGWIGNSAMLTTRQVGPALRLAVVLTNAPLECNEAITESQCPPNCTACANICPMKAISGKRWARGIHRDEFFNVDSCKKGRSQQGGLCWKCISVCPLAIKGLG
ncbi:MAG: hypothetical protein FWC16_08485 [Defluviitaleaceae bacterium]|nr:hypothetical protein [Defluviitaleaceae bacterium]